MKSVFFDYFVHILIVYFSPPGVNFVNVLRAGFTHTDFESAKKTVKLSSCFALLGSLRVKAARRMLMKLTPGYFKNDPFQLR